MNRLQERRMALGLTQPQVSARLKETEPRADVGMEGRGGLHALDDRDAEELEEYRREYGGET